jgi:hypothetical protein
MGSDIKPDITVSSYTLPDSSSLITKERLNNRNYIPLHKFTNCVDDHKYWPHHEVSSENWCCRSLNSSGKLRRVDWRIVTGRPQITIWRMRIAFWITKATNTRSEYVILIAFPRQWLRERASTLHYTYTACLVSAWLIKQPKNARNYGRCV